MKETSRPVPKGNKRRKIAALEIPGGNQSAASIEPSGQHNNGDEEEKKEEESKKPLGSKRNKTAPQQFNIWIMPFSNHYYYPFYFEIWD